MSPIRIVPRYPFEVDVEIMELESQIQICGRTTDLSLFGCGISGLSNLRRGSNVRIKLAHRGAEVVALGRVVYARQDLGAGIAFTSVEPKDEHILVGWIAELAQRLSD